MRQVLVLGGTGWVGRETVRQLVAGGAEVTCLARGDSGEIPDGARLVRADRREQDAYDAVRGDWDEVIEFSYAPDLVGPAVDTLADRAAHWTLVSTVSVYARNDEEDVDESADLVEPVDLTQYPDAKVAAERTTAARVGDRLLIARPGLIVGAGDPSDRFGYWPARFTRPGPALAPTTEGRVAQVIDVGDLAAWIAGAGAQNLVGAVNAVGESWGLDDVLATAARAAGHSGDLVEAPDDTLLAHDVHYWAGPRSLPLWIPLSYTGFARRSGRRFLETGGALTPLAETVATVLDDERARGVDRARRAGMTASDERAVLSAIARE